MALTIKTPAAERNLTTLSAVHDALGITDTTIDAFLTRVIEASSDAIERYCNRVFARQVYTETIRGSDHPILVLTQTPILAVASVLSDGEPITDYVLDDPDVGSLYREVGWFRNAWIGWATEPATLPTTEAPTYTVEYTAGYYLPGESGRNLPSAIEQAAILTVSDVFMKSTHGTGNIKSKKVGDLSIEYTQSAEGQFASVEVNAIPAAARSLLPVRYL